MSLPHLIHVGVAGGFILEHSIIGFSFHCIGWLSRKVGRRNTESRASTIVRNVFNEIGSRPVGPPDPNEISKFSLNLVRGKDYTADFGKLDMFQNLRVLVSMSIDPPSHRKAMRASTKASQSQKTVPRQQQNREAGKPRCVECRRRHQTVGVSRT